MFWPLYP